MNSLASKGFTLIELTMTLVIITILASFAIPKFINAVERQRASEGENILNVLYGAQLRTKYDAGSFTNNVDVLDVQIPPASNFNAPVALDGTSPEGSVASIQRNGATYVLYVDDTGSISCDGTPCQKLGFAIY